MTICMSSPSKFDFFIHQLMLRFSATGFCISRSIVIGYPGFYSFPLLSSDFMSRYSIHRSVAISLSHSTLHITEGGDVKRRQIYFIGGEGLISTGETLFRNGISGRLSFKKRKSFQGATFVTPCTSVPPFIFLIFFFCTRFIMKVKFTN